VIGTPVFKLKIVIILAYFALLWMFIYMFAVLGAKFYQVFVFQSVMDLRLHVPDLVQEMEVLQAQMFL
jgi:hypothetical protein